MRLNNISKSVLIALAIAGCLVPDTRGAEAGRPTLDSVLARFVEASGGAEAIRKVHSRHIKGTLSSAMFGSASWELLAKAPDKRLTLTEIPGFGAMTDGCDGKVVWSDSPMAGLVERQGEEAERTRRDGLFYRDLQLKELYPGLELVGAATVNGEAAWQTKAQTAGGSYDLFYFSQDSGRLIRHEAEFTGQNGATRTVSQFGDFRPVDGLSVPHHIALEISSAATSGLKLDLRITEVKQNVEIADARFAKPAE